MHFMEPSFSLKETIMETFQTSDRIAMGVLGLCADKGLLSD